MSESTFYDEYNTIPADMLHLYFQCATKSCNGKMVLISQVICPICKLTATESREIRDLPTDDKKKCPVCTFHELKTAHSCSICKNLFII